MPKIKKTEEQKMDLALKSSMAAQMTLFEYDLVQISRWLDISISTLYLRKKDPETFSVKELRILSKKLNFSAEQICQILGVKSR